MPSTAHYAARAAAAERAAHDAWQAYWDAIAAQTAITRTKGAYTDPALRAARQSQKAYRAAHSATIAYSRAAELHRTAALMDNHAPAPAPSTALMMRPAR